MFALYHFFFLNQKLIIEFTVIDFNSALCLQLTTAVSGGVWPTILYFFHCE